MLQELIRCRFIHYLPAPWKTVFPGSRSKRLPVRDWHFLATRRRHALDRAALRTARTKHPARKTFRWSPTGQYGVGCKRWGGADAETAVREHHHVTADTALQARRLEGWGSAERAK